MLSTPLTGRRDPGGLPWLTRLLRHVPESFGLSHEPFAIATNVLQRDAATTMDALSAFEALEGWFERLRDDCPTSPAGSALSLNYEAARAAVARRADMLFNEPYLLLAYFAPSTDRGSDDACDVAPLVQTILESLGVEQPEWARVDTLIVDPVPGAVTVELFFLLFVSNQRDSSPFREGTRQRKTHATRAPWGANSSRKALATYLAPVTSSRALVWQGVVPRLNVPRLPGAAKLIGRTLRLPLPDLPSAAAMRTSRETRGGVDGRGTPALGRRPRWCTNSVKRSAHRPGAPYLTGDRRLAEGRPLLLLHGKTDSREGCVTTGS